MKYLLPLILLMPSVSFSQSQQQLEKTIQHKIIGEVKSAGYLIAKLSYRVADKDTLYSFMFLNQKYESLSDYQTISFTNHQNTLKQLYGILKNCFSEENKIQKRYKVDFKLGQEWASARLSKLKGEDSVLFDTEHGLFHLLEKQVDKLFGRG